MSNPRRSPALELATQTATDLTRDVPCTAARDTPWYPEIDNLLPAFEDFLDENPDCQREIIKSFLRKMAHRHFHRRAQDQHRQQHLYGYQAHDRSHGWDEEELARSTQECGS